MWREMRCRLVGAQAMGETTVLGWGLANPTMIFCSPLKRVGPVPEER